MFPGTLDTKEGQAAAVAAKIDVGKASACLHDAARYMAMAWAHHMATGENADHWFNSSIDGLGRALAAIGYRMVPVDQPTPEEARRLALEKMEQSFRALPRHKRVRGEPGYADQMCVRADGSWLKAQDAFDAIRALLSELSK